MTLEDLYFITGSIAFTFFSVSIVVIAVFSYRTGKKIQEAQNKSKIMVQNALYTKYAIQAGFFKCILTLLGGDRRNE